ncbi:MAG: sodium:alanine symporter family protein, partial [Clostridiaceae bacterium]|nr:sodium:alanine symporter family protein [Clostridiaceae bacterium]
MDMIMKLVTKGNDFLWSFLLILLLCGTGLYYTIRLKFIQVRKFGEGCKQVFGHFSLNGEKHEKGEMSPFQSIATAIAAQVGTGNLAGAATALIGGGPGAIFWMWVSAFFGMATIYAEAVLAQTYKTEVNGEVTGGPVYYIKAAFRGTFGKVLAALFSVFIVLALGFMGNMVQSNSIGAAFVEVAHTFGVELPPIVIGLILAAFASFIFLGGTKRLAAVVEKIVPIMAGVYIVGSLLLICMNITHIPAALVMILKGAFHPEAVVGAGAGIAVREAIRFGVARGLFSNEAGMGSTPHAHARAKAESPHQQGLCAMISVFIDTFIILNLTVFAVLTTGVMSSGKDGTALTQAAFQQGFGSFGIIFVAACLLFFAFSTILGWHFFGLINAKYLFGEKAGKVYSFIVVLCIVIGSALKLELVWALADFFNGLMVIPNI